MKRFIFIISAIFFTTLAVVVGIRMSPDAMAMIVGVLLGVAATIPTTFLLFFVFRQREKQAETQHRAAGYPPVVVVNGQPSAQSHGSGLNPALLPPAGERSFKVIGQDDMASETLGGAFNISSIWDEVS